MSGVYLDWAATAPPDPEILNKIAGVAVDYYANPSAVHGEGRRAAQLLEEQRRKLADLLDCPPGDVVFTSGGTESNNMVLLSQIQPPAAIAQLRGSRGRGGRRIVISGLEHTSVYEPAAALQRFGHEVLVVPAGADGLLDPGSIARNIDERTSLVAVMLVSNETGAVQPVSEIGRAVAELRRRSGRRIHLHCDAVQAFGKIPLRPRELGVDSLALSAHKIGGPRGAGALFIRASARQDFLYRGGGQEGGRRPGTENLPGIHGLVLSAEQACRHLEDNLRHATAVTERLVRELDKIEGVVFIPAVRSPGGGRFSPYILNVAFPPVPGEVLVRVLEEEGYLVSTGSACSSRKKNRFRVHENMGIPAAVSFSAVRISLGPAVESQDLEGLVPALKRRLPELRRVSTR